MTKSQRKLLRTTGLMGLLLTAVVVVLDQWDVLTYVERKLGDTRVKHCQFFGPPLTDRIVHVDIGDAAIKTMGQWPWPRSVLSKIVEELNAAGAKVVAFDVMFLEHDRVVPSDSRGADPLAPTSNDLELAKALHDCWRALLPVTFGFTDSHPKDPVYHAAVTELENDLELDEEQLRTRLEASGWKSLDRDLVDAVFIPAREEAMLQRLLTEKQLETEDFAQLRVRLLPGNALLSGSPTQRLLAQEYQKAVGIRLAEKWGRPAPRGIGRPLQAVEIKPNIPVLARAAGYVGSVSFVPEDDGNVRKVPLCIEYQQRIYPQFGFALACAYMGVDFTDPKQVRIQERRVTIHPPGGEQIVVPVSTLYSPGFGYVSMLIDVPWIGHDWLGMYGTDSAGRPKQHLAIDKVWEIREKREALVKNCAQADEGMSRFLKIAGLEPPRALRNKFREYQAHLPPPVDSPQRRQMIQEVRKQFQEDVESETGYRAISKNLALKPKERVNAGNIVAGYDQLGLLPRQIAETQSELDSAFRLVQRDVANRAVLIGWTAEGLTDVWPNPIGANTPGVIAHGTIFNGIITGRLLYRPPRWITVVVTVLLGILTTAAVILMSPWPALGTTAALAATYLAINGIFLYDRHHVILGLAGPVAATAVVWSGSTLFRYILERAERTRITQRFRTYVDPGLVNYVTETEKERLDGEKRECTILFTDLQGFTTLTERLGEGAVHVLGEYMGEMVPAIRACRGYVNKFIGDGIMCLFNALEPDPDHAGGAMAAVVQMNCALASFNERLKARNLPTLVMRAGINTGTVIVGDAGPPHIASDYTALGDGVNLASRLESANKIVGTCTMIGQRTAELLNGRYLLRPIGRLRVVGKTEPVMTYEPLAPSEQANDDQKRLVEATTRIVDLFQAGRFAECIEAIQCAEKRLGSSSKLFELYKTLAERYQHQCPADFRGEIVLGEK